MILEYEWHSTHRVFRRFELPHLKGIGNRALSGLSWVPARMAHYGGYFFVASQFSGAVSARLALSRGKKLYTSMTCLLVKDQIGGSTRAGLEYKISDAIL